MRGMKYGFSFFKKNIFSNLFIALEIALLLVGSNALLGFYNNLSVLYTPYEKIFTDDGVLLTGDYSAVRNYEEAQAAFLSTLSSLKGGPQIYCSYIYTYNTDDRVLLVHIISDEIYDRFYYTTELGSFEPGCAVASYMSGLSVGDMLRTSIGEVRVSGVLTETTYFPSITLCEYVEDLYSPYTSGTDENEFVTMSVSSAEKLFGTLSPETMSDTVLISYKGCTKKEIDYNNALLKTQGTLSELDKINSRSEGRLREQYARFVPFIYIISIAVVIGIVSFCIVTSLDNNSDLDILYNSGAGRDDIFFVLLGKNICIIASALIMSGFGLMMLKLMHIMSRTGILMMKNSIPVSAFILLLCVIMCQVISGIACLSFGRKVK